MAAHDRDDAGLAPFNAASKFDTEMAFLEQLFALGRDFASGWLAAHRGDVGVRSSLDIDTAFLGKAGKAGKAGSLVAAG